MKPTDPHTESRKELDRNFARALMHIAIWGTCFAILAAVVITMAIKP